MSFLDQALLLSVRKTLLTFDDLEAADVKIVLEILESIPIDNQTPYKLVQEVSDGDAAITALLFKYGSIRDRTEETRKAHEAVLARDIVEQKEGIGKNAPQHLVETKLASNPEIQRIRYRAAEVARLVVFLDNIKWSLIRKTELTQEIFKKEMTG